MDYKIVWTKTAERQFDRIVKYIEQEWSKKISVKFIEQTNEILSILKLYPEAGSIEIRDKKIRGFLISRQVRLFYRMTKKELILLSFFDTRLNPEKRLKEIR